MKIIFETNYYVLSIKFKNIVVKLSGIKRSVYVMEFTVISKVRKIQILKLTSSTRLRGALLTNLYVLNYLSVKF